MTFTPKQLEHFRKYEEVRQTGKHSMFSPQAMQLVGVSRVEYTWILQNYAALKQATEQVDPNAWAFNNNLESF